MQTLNAMIAIGGDRNNTLFKEQLTPMEVLLLQQLHGADSIGALEPTGNIERDPMEEMARLRVAYPLQHERIQNLWRDYPGDRFPQRLSHLGLNPALLKPAEASQAYTVSAKPAAAA